MRSAIRSFELFQNFLFQPRRFLNAVITLERTQFNRFAGIEFDHVCFIPDELRRQENQ